MKTHQYKENKLSPGNCIACGLIEDCERHSKAPEEILSELSKYEVKEGGGGGSKAPEISMVSIDVEPVKKLEFEAPTDESWEKELESLNDYHNNKAWAFSSSNDKLKSFIASLIQKERERGIAEGRADEAIFCHEHKGGGYEAGKSEAFSLVKKMIEEELQGRFAFNGGLQHLLSELSTLEGK